MCRIKSEKQPEVKRLIKGCNKRVIVMRDTGNDMIEEAIFIIRPSSDKGLVSEENMIRHANSILERSCLKGGFSGVRAEARCKKGRRLIPFAFGVMSGAAFAAAVFLVL